MLTFIFFFFNDTATTEIYTLSLHDALPICQRRARDRAAEDLGHGLPGAVAAALAHHGGQRAAAAGDRDRKSTRLNSSHLVISYAVFCLKKKKQNSSRCRADISRMHDQLR